MYRQARPIYRNMPPNHGNNRIVGGFLGPFILGGIIVAYILTSGLFNKTLFRLRKWQDSIQA